MSFSVIPLRRSCPSFRAALCGKAGALALVVALAWPDPACAYAPIAYPLPVSEERGGASAATDSEASSALVSSSSPAASARAAQAKPQVTYPSSTLTAHAVPLSGPPVAAATPSLPRAAQPEPQPRSQPQGQALPPMQALDQETLITAQWMNADQKNGIVTASGKVEIARGGYVLHADKVSYNQKTKVMRAEGNVAMLTPTGEVQFADAEEITGDMKQAFAENIGILFPDNSRMAARSAQRYEGRYLVADKAMYTSCNVCKENPDNPPLWQIRAREVTHDSEEHNIYYHDATLDMAGIPVFYTPYLSTPDPTVERRQGFLPPMPGTTPNIGGFVRVPYYFDIAPDMDAVVAPTFSQEDKVQFGGELRKRFADGYMQLNGSVTRGNLISDAGVDEGDQWRGHLFGRFLYNIDNVWRAGTDIAFTSDKSYLQRYRITSADELTNRAWLEGFSGRNYAVVNGYYFQDLRPGTQPVQPIVLPQASFSLLGEPGQTLGGRWSLDGSALVTSRDNAGQSLSQQGPNTRRLTLQAGWERRLISDTGLVTDVSGLARGNAYWADNVIDPNGSGRGRNGVTVGRHFEQANVTVRYPMGRSGNGYQQLLEPIAAFTAAPAFKADPLQPIEDSLNVQFDETNLFAPNRFTGNDLIERGSRATWGLRHVLTADNGARIGMFGGQSYNFSKNDDFPGLSGLRDKVSDYVGRVDFSPASWMDLNYGFRLDHDTLAAQRQDALLSVGAPVFRPYIRYISAYQTETTGTVANVEQATIGFDSRFAKYWLLHGDHTRSFKPQPGPRSSALTFGYIDECLVFGVTVSHNDTERADLSAGTSAVFHLYLKNLGGVHTDSFTDAQFPAEFRQTR